MNLVVLVLCLISQNVFSSVKAEKVDAGCIVTNYKQISSAIKKCDHLVLSNLVVPGGKTLQLDLHNGTTISCKGNITFEFASWAGPLVAINGSNVVIDGNECIFDGKGPEYWDGKGEWGSLKPMFFTISVHNSIMRNIYVLNSPIHCVYLVDSTDVGIFNWTINNKAGDQDVAGSKSFGHNTDGFDLFNVTNAVLKDVLVHNQDDCVAIRFGANILVDNFLCINGHGLSVSVGFSNVSYVQNTLFNVTFQNSVLKGGQNGLHIKTHVDGTTGLIQNLTYRNIEISGPSKYGINIQQNYRNLPPHTPMPLEPDDNVPIRDLTLDNVSGSVVKSAVPIYILCADKGCSGWRFTDVNVKGKKKNNCNFVPDGFSC